MATTLAVGLSTMSFDAASAAPKHQTIQVRIVDESGAPRPAATAVACPIVDEVPQCWEAVTADANPIGLAQLRLSAATNYHVYAVVAAPEPSWPCPEAFSDGIDGLGAELPRNVSFTIAEPSPFDCVVVTVTDDSGSPLSAGLFVCGHEPESSDCIGDFFEGPDPDSIIRLKVDPDLTYDIGTFVGDVDWPCPQWVTTDGSYLWFGESGTFTVDELLAGVTLVIPKPSPYDCVHILITDDSSNSLPNSSVWLCAHLPGSAECVGPGGVHAQPDGVVVLDVDPTLTYDLTPVAENTGWPCPSEVSPDGTTFHLGEQTSIAGAELLAGLTLVVPVPAPDDCVSILIADDSGNPLPYSYIAICAHLPGSSECLVSEPQGASGDGVVRMSIDPTLVYDLKPVAMNTGWPCPHAVLPDGTDYFGTEVSVTVDELLAGVTLVVPVPSPDDCVPVLITDDSGNPLPYGLVSICAHPAGYVNCIGPTDGGADENGIVTVMFDPSFIYDLRPVALNSGWPCPQTVLPDGRTFHHGELTTLTADELAAGVTLVVPIPSPEDCAA